MKMGGTKIKRTTVFVVIVFITCFLSLAFNSYVGDVKNIVNAAAEGECVNSLKKVRIIT